MLESWRPCVPALHSMQQQEWLRLVRGPVDPKIYRKLGAFLHAGKPYLTYRCHPFLGVCPFFSLWIGKGTGQGEQCSKPPLLGTTCAEFRPKQNSAPASLPSCVSIQMRHLLNCTKERALGGGKGEGRREGCLCIYLRRRAGVVPHGYRQLCKKSHGLWWGPSVVIGLVPTS